MDDIIKVSGLSFKYDSIDVLKNISFNLKVGDYVGLVCYNGS